MTRLLALYDKARHAVRYFLLRRLPTCKDLTPIMSQSLERRLTLRERVVLRAHLYTCAWCEWYLRQIAELHEGCATRDQYDESAGPALSDEARERIRKALEKD